MKLIKRFLYITIIVFFLSVVIWYFYPKKYDKTLDGVYYQLGDNDVYEEVSVQLNGTLQNLISGDNRFEGTIEIQGEQLPMIPENREKLVLYYDREGPGIIASYLSSGGDGVLITDNYTFGLIYTDSNFEQFSVMIHTRDADNPDGGSWTGMDGYLITAPARNRDEALDITDKLFNHVKREGDMFIYSN